jgi:hypothetical protein
VSILTTVTVKRASVQKYTNIAVQLDNISAVVIANSGGAIPTNSYNLISTQGVPDILHDDLLIDEGTNAWNVDTRTTSGKAEYRVSGNPEVYPFDHLESMVTRNVSKTP